MIPFKHFIVEKLTVSDGVESWIRDFIKSDAPQFKGKTKKERIDMAYAAFKSAEKGLEEESPCWKDYKQIGTKKKNGKEVPNCVPVEEEAIYEEKKVKLNNPFRTPDGPKKFSVYVKNDKGNVVKVNFGDPNMEIKRDDPKRRASFRARHKCNNPGPKWKARYWSCYQWRAGAKVDN